MRFGSSGGNLDEDGGPLEEHSELESLAVRGERPRLQKRTVNSYEPRPLGFILIIPAADF